MCVCVRLLLDSFSFLFLCCVVLCCVSPRPRPYMSLVLCVVFIFFRVPRLCPRWWSATIVFSVEGPHASTLLPLRTFSFSFSFSLRPSRMFSAKEEQRKQQPRRRTSVLSGSSVFSSVRVAVPFPSCHFTFLNAVCYCADFSSGQYGVGSSSHPHALCPSLSFPSSRACSVACPFLFVPLSLLPSVSLSLSSLSLSLSLLSPLVCEYDQICESGK